jgi:hypothetical protein
VEKRSSGSVVKIDTKVATNVKVYFSKFFMALKPCIDGFKEGSDGAVLNSARELVGV